MNKFGGDFEFAENFESMMGTELSSSYYISGRGALSAILQELTIRDVSTLYIPEYICSSVVKVCKAYKFKILEYPLKYDLKVEFTFFEGKDLRNQAILLVNYFGLQDLNYVTTGIKSFAPESILILDNVQNSLRNDLAGADYCFNSLRKFLPIAEGAVIKSKIETKFRCFPNTSNYHMLKTLGMNLKFVVNKYRLSEEIYLTVLQLAEKLLDEVQMPFSMTSLSHMVLSHLDIDMITKIRMQNYGYTKALFLEQKVPLLLNQNESGGLIPLVIPLLIENRDSVREQLKKNKIFLPVHWKNGNSRSISGFWSANELSFVIDQRFSFADLLFMFEKLLEAEPRFIGHDNF